MRKTIAALLVLGAIASAAALAAGSPTEKTARNAALGKTILVTASGRTLYYLRTERRAAIGCDGACAKLWPPLLVPRGTKPVAGPGLKEAELGTATRPGGLRQVTYAGVRLYRYALDRKAGDARGNGVGGVWLAVTAKAAASAPAPPPPATGGGYGGGGYGGGGYTP